MLFAHIAGRIGRDAETRQAGSNTVTSWSVAVDQRIKSEKVTTWVRCSLWGKRGEALAQYLTKGGQVACAGTLTLREYEGKTQVELEVAEVTLMGGKSDADERPARQQAPARQAPAGGLGDLDDDIPF